MNSHDGCSWSLQEEEEEERVVSVKNCLIHELSLSAHFLLTNTKLLSPETQRHASLGIIDMLFAKNK